MKYIEINDIKKCISKIGLGTAKFGSRIDEGLAFEMLDIFSENGGTFIDTARNYDEWALNGRGKSEQCLGTWISNRGNRDRIVICTKGGVRRNNIGDRYFDLSYDNLCEEVKESINALNTEYIDMYLLHKDEKSRNVEEIVDTMQKVSEIGKIRKIGVANWSYSRLKKANYYAEKNNLKRFEVVQTWWSLAEYTREMWNDENTTYMTNDMYKYLIEENMLCIAYTAQCKGFFQKAIKGGLISVDEFLKKRIVTENNLKKLCYIKNLCKKNNINPTAIVNGYITNNLLNGIALVSCTTLDQLYDILSCCDYKLDIDIINKIDSI